MKTLIVYETRYGTVEKSIDIIASKLEVKPIIMRTKEALKTDLDEYDNILIGGSIAIGKIQKEIKTFIQKRSDILKKKKLILFIAAAATKPEDLEKEINDAFSEDIRKSAAYVGHIGFGFDFDKMNFITKGIIKKAMNVEESSLHLKEDVIDEIANLING